MIEVGSASLSVLASGPEHAGRYPLSSALRSVVLVKLGSIYLGLSQDIIYTLLSDYQHCKLLELVNVRYCYFVIHMLNYFDVNRKARLFAGLDFGFWS
ncbi:hypothetical protein [Sphingobacterium griseoflavum]|uniref:hypothetical protein n=1 Tax=Sphingobacterium griseoflavum TaxID=1474952 RepID=UPI001676EDFC|nr:hypothetical protein [Sphingobacterium griseoflavum]